MRDVARLYNMVNDYDMLIIQGSKSLIMLESGSWSKGSY